MSSRVSGQASPSKLIQIQNEALKDGIGMEKVAPNLCNLVWQDASKKTAFHEKYPTLRLHDSFSTVGVGRR